MWLNDKQFSPVLKKEIKKRVTLLVPSDYMWALLPDVIVVIISEVVVDVIKHAFITKFNEIPADVSNKEVFSLLIFNSMIPRRVSVSLVIVTIRELCMFCVFQ